MGEPEGVIDIPKRIHRFGVTYIREDLVEQMKNELIAYVIDHTAKSPEPKILLLGELKKGEQKNGRTEE